MEYQPSTSCGYLPKNYVIYLGLPRMKDHQCGIVRYQKKELKICVYLISKLVNCIMAYRLNFSCCNSRYKVEISVRKKKKLKKLKNKKITQYSKQQNR